MSTIREIYVVPNTHWDREFRESFERTRDHLVDMMDITLDLMVKDPAYKYYVLDGHCILLKDYLELRPEMTETVTQLLRERRLLIGPWYTLPDTPNVGAEALARNFLFARKYAEEFGVEVMKAGYTPCNWGQPSQLPQIYHQLGLQSALFYRGISPHECPAEWIWEAPDGSEILGHRFGLLARYNWYYLVFRPATYGIDPFDKDYKLGQHGESVFRRCEARDDAANFENMRILNPPAEHFFKEKLIPSIEHMLEMEAPEYGSPYFLAMHGHDVSVGHPLDPKHIAEADAGQDKYKVVMSNLEDYVAKVRAWIDEQPDAPRLKGERRSNLKRGFYTYLLPATISARIPLKIANAVSERMLSLQAEPLAALAMAVGRPYPTPQIDRAWSYILDCHTHDAIAGCAPDSVTEDVMFRLRQAGDLAGVVMDRSMQHVAKNLDLSDSPEDGVHVLAFNPLPFVRGGTVQAEVAFPGDAGAKGLRLVDAAGKEIPFQLIASEKDSLFVDSIWDVPKIASLQKFTFIARIEEVPAVGYTTLRAEPLPFRTRTYGSLSPETNVLENEFVRIEARPNGSIDLVDKQMGRRYEQLNHFRDDGVAGNAWTHTPPRRNAVYTSLGGQAQWALVKDGPFEAKLEASLTLTLPVDLEARETVGGATMDLPIRTTYTLRKGDPKVSIETWVDNRVCDHWLRAVFPTGIDTGASLAETHFDVVDRAIEHPDRRDWIEDTPMTGFMNNLVSLTDGEAGFSLMSEGLLEYEVFDQAERPLALTLLRGMWVKLEVSEEKKQILPDRGPQVLGAHTLRYAVYAHAGGPLEANAIREAQDWRSPLQVAQVGRSTGTLPKRAGLLDAGGSDCIVTCVKKAADSDQVLVRAYNPADQEGVLKLHTEHKLSGAWSYAIHERSEKEIAFADHEVVVKVPKKRIVTIGLELKAER